MKIKYLQLEDNDKLEISANGERIRFACCDCGLVHSMAFAIEKNGNIGIAIKRNVSATRTRRARIRRAREFANLVNSGGLDVRTT